MTLQIHIFADHEAVSREVANRLRSYLHAHPTAVLALPSGSTPERTYALLAEHGEGLCEATVFALDEYLGLGAGDAASFRSFFERHVFGPLKVPPERAHVLDGQAPEPDSEAAAYEIAIQRAGGLDLTVLGLGANGHIAFNEPGPSLSVHTHVTPLAPPASAIAALGITMGVGTLLAAPQVWLIATGTHKAAAVAAMLAGQVDPACPASLLQLHPHAEVFLDTSAAGGLSAIVDASP